MYFRHFVIISPWKRAGPFIWTNLNPLHPRMLCAKFDWNWPSGSGEDENVKSLQTDRQTDGRTDRRRTTGDQKSSLEVSAQVSLKLLNAELIISKYLPNLYHLQIEQGSLCWSIPQIELSLTGKLSSSMAWSLHTSCFVQESLCQPPSISRHHFVVFLLLSANFVLVGHH